MGLVQDKGGSSTSTGGHAREFTNVGKRTILPRIESDPTDPQPSMTPREPASKPLLPVMPALGVSAGRLSVKRMGYACDPRTIRKTMHEMGYHKGDPRKKFNVSPEKKEKRVAWCQARLHWTKEEWKRVIWTDGSSFSTAGFGHRIWAPAMGYPQS